MSSGFTSRPAIAVNPRPAIQLSRTGGKPGGEIDLNVGCGIRAGRVIDANRRFLGVAQRDLAERDARCRDAAFRRGIDLPGPLDRSGGHRLRRRGEADLAVGVHGCVPPLQKWVAGEGRRRPYKTSSLRRHDPDQVQRVRRTFAVSAHIGRPSSSRRMTPLPVRVSIVGKGGVKTSRRTNVAFLVTFPSQRWTKWGGSEANPTFHVSFPCGP